MPRRRLLAAIAVLTLFATPSTGRSEDAGMVVRRAKGPLPITVDPTDEEGVLSGKLVEDMAARVKSVDLTKREITLSGSGGRVETMKAGPEVKNLEKLERGDRVSIRYRGGLVLRPLAEGEAATSPDVKKDLKGTGQGDILSGTETVRARVTVTVAAIDPATRLVTLKGPEGKTVPVKMGPAVALDRFKVGDRFTATYSAAMAVAVQPIYKG